MEIINYTIKSTREEDFSEVWTNLQQPWTPKAKLTITGLTTNCNIVVLDENDYIKIDETTFYASERYTNLSSTSLAELLTIQLSEIDISVELTHSNTLLFISTASKEFTLNDCTYNYRLLLGLYETKFPINSIGGIIRIEHCGYFLSTPVLYLLSNLGDSCYQNTSEFDYQNAKIVMRINNSFSNAIPIVSNNVEFSTIVQSAALSNVWFKLVDANFHPIKILNPIYILGIGEAIREEETENDAIKAKTLSELQVQLSQEANANRLAKIILVNDMLKPAVNYLHDGNIP
jgi:hypothetical protein